MLYIGLRGFRIYGFTGFVGLVRQAARVFGSQARSSGRVWSKWATRNSRFSAWGMLEKPLQDPLVLCHFGFTAFLIGCVLGGFVGS